MQGKRNNWIRWRVVTGEVRAEVYAKLRKVSKRLKSINDVDDESN